MTLDALAFAEESERSLLLGRRHGVPVASGKPVNRRICQDEGELELGNRAAEHGEINRAAAMHGWEQCAKKRPVGRCRVQPCQYNLPDRLIPKTTAVG